MSASPDCRTVDEAHPELSATLGLAWSSPDVLCPVCGERPAMLDLTLSVAVSPHEPEPKQQKRLSCDLARCYLSWWSLADAVVVDVHPLTREVAAKVTGLAVAA